MPDNDNKPRVVKEVPKGYKKEIKDGKEVYVFRKQNNPLPEKSTTSTNNKVVYKSSGKPPKRKLAQPTYSEDVVILEPNSTIPVPTDTTVVDNKKYFLGPDAKSHFRRDDSNPLYTTYTAPNETGNYTNQSITYYTDKSGKPIYQPDSKDFINGVFKPRYTGETLEQLRGKSLQQYTLPSADNVTKKNTDPNAKTFSDNFTMSTNETGGGVELKQIKVQPKLYDNEGNLINNEVKNKDKETVYTMPKFAKGGLVKKIKGYKDGTDSDGIVGQNDPYAEAKKKERQKETSQQIGTAVSAIGKAVYKEPTNIYQNENEKNTEIALNSAADTIGNTAKAASPWYGIATGASDIGRSMLSKDKYGENDTNASKGFNELFTSSGDRAMKAASKGDGLGTIREITGFGKMARAITSFQGKDKETKGFWGDVNKLTGQTATNEEKNRPFVQQLEEVNKANAQDMINQAMANRNSGNLEGKTTLKYDIRNPQYDENKRLILGDGTTYMGTQTLKKGGLVQKLKDGGQIKGKGTAKSDSINAKVEEGSFVVPAENAEIAKGIRELYLKVPKSKKANLNQKEGEEVKLSNGEHLFTPEENEYLESIGIELEDLAPNAEEKDEMANGGLTSKKAKMILRDKEVNGKPLTEKQRKFFGAISSGESIKGYKDGTTKNGVKSSKSVNTKKELAKIKLEKEKELLDKQKKEKYKAILEKERQRQKSLYNEKADKNKKELDVNKEKIRLGTELKSLKEAYKSMSNEFDNSKITKVDRLVGVEGVKNKEYQRNKKEELLNEIKNREDALVSIDKNTSSKSNNNENKTKTNTNKIDSIETKTTESKPQIKVPSSNKNTSSKSNNNENKTKTNTNKIDSIETKTSEPSYKFKVPSAEYNPSDDVTVTADKLSPDELVALQVEQAKTAKENENAMALNKSLPQELPTTTTTSVSNKKTSNLLGNIDPTAFVGVAQSALGMNMLKGEKRPVWNPELDATYNENVNRAIKDASFGLTPEQKFLAEQDIQNSLRDAKFQGVNFAGGSGVQAYNLNRSAINDAWKNKLGLKQTDTEMRMQKQKYADAQVADRANILANNRRTAFGDAMNAFQQKQQAGSELIGAGLSNVIGAYRFNQEMRNRKNADAAR